MASEKKSQSGEKSYFWGVVLRLFILAVTVTAILAVGYYRYGWRPLGPKIHADQLGHNGADSAEGEKEPALTDVIKDSMDLPTPAPTPETEPAAPIPTPTPTPTPTPKSITKDDQKELKDLLKDKVK